MEAFYLHSHMLYVQEGWGSTRAMFKPIDPNFLSRESKRNHISPHCDLNMVTGKSPLVQHSHKVLINELHAFCF